MQQYHSQISPINDLNSRLQTIDQRVQEGCSIFDEKFIHIDRQLDVFMQMIEEDQEHRKEIENLRKEEINMLS